MRVINCCWRVVSDIPGRPLIIADTGHDAGCMSVTNAAEQVVAVLVRGGLLPAGRRLWYYDSQDELSELCVAGGVLVFAGFGALHPEDIAWAAKVRR